MPDWLHAFLTFQVVAVVAGSIAYLGNQLGRKIGKRKMTVFKMRPRHTSNFMTALIGIVIAWTTLGVAAMLSVSVRGLIVGIGDLQAEEMRLREEIRRLKDEMEEVQKARIAWNVDSPIVMGTLNPSLGDEVLRQQLIAALTAANAEVVRANNDIAVTLMQPPLRLNETMIQWGPEDIQGALKQLADKTEVWGVKVWATENGLYKKRIPIRVELTPVTRVYKEGEVIVRRPVQPSDPQLLVLWYDFLDELKTAATARGMIQIKNSLGGGVTGQDLARVSERMTDLRAPATLVAVARRDLYQTSPLDVKLEVRE